MRKTFYHPSPPSAPVETVELPGGVVIHGVTESQARLLRGRGEAVARFAAEKGKPVEALTFEEVLEIRARPEWKTPLGAEPVEPLNVVLPLGAVTLDDTET